MARIDYELLARELPILKGRLTRAKKKGPQAVIDEVDHAFDRFDSIGWPDAWHTWNIAKQDALVTLHRESWGNPWT